MTTPINYDLEKHLLNGCTIIEKQSLNYDSANKDFTHILLKCPKDYFIKDSSDIRAVLFLTVVVFDGKWFIATKHYSTQRNALKYFWDNLTDDRITNMRIKENKK